MKIRMDNSLSSELAKIYYKKKFKLITCLNDFISVLINLFPQYLIGVISFIIFYVQNSKISCCVPLLPEWIFAAISFRFIQSLKDTLF